jgi:hypothetical protein
MKITLQNSLKMTAILTVLCLALSATIGLASISTSTTLASSGSVNYNNSPMSASSLTAESIPVTTSAPIPPTTQAPTTTSAPSPAPTSTQTTAPTPTQTKTPTSTNTPTPTPTPVHSEIKFNAVFCWVTISDNDLHNLLSHQIYNLFLQTSYLGSSGFYGSASGWSDAQITAFVDHIHAYDARFKVLCWLGVRPEISVPDITTSQNRATIVASEVNYVSSHHFDGMALDSEYPWGQYQGNANDQNAFDWYNAEASAMHNIGKITAPYIFNAVDAWQVNFDNWLALMKTLTCDYIVLTEGLGANQAISESRISTICNSVNKPIMQSVGYGNLGAYITYWNDLVSTYGIPNRLAGFAVYVMPTYVSGIEWNAWDNWSLKNLS